jgi:hypothetical protein
MISEVHWLWTMIICACWQLVVRCNVTHAQGGSIYLFEPTSPTAKKWTHTATLTTTTADVFRAGTSMVRIHRGIVLADVEDNANYLNAANDAVVFVKGVVFSRDKGKWTQMQVLRAGNDKTNDDITDWQTPAHAVVCAANSHFSRYDHPSQHRLQVGGIVD